MGETMEGVGTKLLPCPFCGAEPEVYDFMDGRCVISCVSDRCAVRPFTRIRDSRDEAVADWNGRA